jgi:hypothetical protein
MRLVGADLYPVLCPNELKRHLRAIDDAHTAETTKATRSTAVSNSS